MGIVKSQWPTAALKRIAIKTTNSVKVMLQVPNERISFQVVFELFAGSDDAITIGLKTIRESLDINIG